MKDTLDKILSRRWIEDPKTETEAVYNSLLLIYKDFCPVGDFYIKGSDFLLLKIEDILGITEDEWLG